MSIFIRSLTSLLIAMCFITNSYAMAVSEVNQPVVEHVISNHAAMSDCGMPTMTKHDPMDSGKMDTSHCQKSLCCVAATFEHSHHSIERSIQSIKTVNSAYVDQLTLGIYQLPYRPPNHVLFL
ncbi:MULTISPECIES: hypothetical protein [Acinetobacter]|uniref:DUF2946 domain-containing protein n=1 Tax=Acinetobacter higginsii TaxID=70347 RepID=N9T3I8_9GAMM|nr:MULTISPECIES: hypothetical protein [Acinetobacter]ENX57915.1 hypothetical protein F902_02315 [Acinetobacter higginsii]MCH7304038.1 hypothetical protein [Acinetobacter higginsii]MCI3878166.1 hypothetical protein [Acinetobacter higginsii]